MIITETAKELILAELKKRDLDAMSIRIVEAEEGSNIELNLIKASAAERTIVVNGVTVVISEEDVTCQKSFGLSRPII